MIKNKSKNLKGIVVALKANFLIVQIDYQDFKEDSFQQFSDKSTLLCTRRAKLDYQGLFIDVGDIVCVESIDYNNKRAVISEVEPRKSFSRLNFINYSSFIFIIYRLNKHYITYIYK